MLVKLKPDSPVPRWARSSWLPSLCIGNTASPRPSKTQKGAMNLQSSWDPLEIKTRTSSQRADLGILVFNHLRWSLHWRDGVWDASRDHWDPGDIGSFAIIQGRTCMFPAVCTPLLVAAPGNAKRLSKNGAIWGEPWVERAGIQSKYHIFLCYKMPPCIRCPHFSNPKLRN